MAKQEDSDNYGTASLVLQERCAEGARGSRGEMTTSEQNRGILHGRKVVQVPGGMHTWARKLGS